MSRPLLSPAALLLLLLCGCAGEAAHRQGMDLFAFGKQEEGLAKLAEATRAAPDNQLFRLAYRNGVNRVAGRTLGEAKVQLSAGQFADATASYRRVLRLDPQNAEAISGLAATELGIRHALLLSQAKTSIGAGDLEAAERNVGLVLQENPAQAEARALRESIEEKSGREQVASPALRKSFQKPATLEFRDANLKVVLEALSSHSGLNFVFDKDVPANLVVTVFLREVSVADALETILTTHQLKQRVLNDTTLLIYPDTIGKQSDHQELVVRNFFLANAEAKQVLVMLKTVLKVKNAYADDKLNLLVIRDTPAMIELAERLVATQDVAEPEVMLEVAVLELTRSQVTNLGLDWPNTVTRALTGTTATNEMAKLILNLQDDTTANSVLASPRIRTHNREKALIKIGDRVPIITTTQLQYGASENVQYIDVGLKLEVEPIIFPNDEISIKLALEVSSLGVLEPSTAGGTYRIGTRNAATVLRLKDGETQILGGLINDDDKKSANRFPGLHQFPVIGRLFSSENNNNQKTELVLSITPRIVRGLVPPSQVPSKFWSGTENDPRLHTAHRPKSAEEAARAPAPVIATPVLLLTPDPALALTPPSVLPPDTSATAVSAASQAAPAPGISTVRPLPILAIPDTLLFPQDPSEGIRPDSETEHAAQGDRLR